MRYYAVARTDGNATVSCSGSTLKVRSTSNSVYVVITAGTNYDQKAGNAASNWSFKGPDPSTAVEQMANNAVKTGFSALEKSHKADYTALMGSFTLLLPDTHGTSVVETSKAISSYTSSGAGDPLLEGLLFDFSRYLLISSSRENSLPANLQGKWAEKTADSSNWHSDYHLDINLQMNYWAADQTGLSKVQHGLWNFILDTWIPRGEMSAQLIYNAKGWIAHTGMNIFWQYRSWCRL